MKFSAPHWGWTSGRATPSLRPTPMRQRQQTRQDATYRSRKSVQTNGASSRWRNHLVMSGDIISLKVAASVGMPEGSNRSRSAKGYRVG